MRTVLCVAEKPSIAKSVAQILSGGDLQVVRSIYFLLCYFVIQGTDALPLHARLCAQQNNSRSKYIKNYEFDYNYARSRFIVTSVVGHLMETDFYDTHRKWGSCDPFELFDAPVKVVIAQDKQPIEQNLMTLARRCDVLMIWTDCDREGEHIGKEIASVCARGKPGIVVQRARFSAIIPQCVFFFWLLRFFRVVEFNGFGGSFILVMLTNLRVGDDVAQADSPCSSEPDRIGSPSGCCCGGEDSIGFKDWGRVYKVADTDAAGSCKRDFRPSCVVWYAIPSSPRLPLVPRLSSYP